MVLSQNITEKNRNFSFTTMVRQNRKNCLFFCCPNYSILSFSVILIHSARIRCLPVEFGIGDLLDVIGRIEEGHKDLIELMLHYGHQILERELNGVDEQQLGVEAHLCQVHVLLEKVEQLGRVG